MTVIDEPAAYDAPNLGNVSLMIEPKAILPFYHLVARIEVDNIEAGQHFLAFGERSIGDRVPLAVKSYPDGFLRIVESDAKSQMRAAGRRSLRE